VAGEQEDQEDQEDQDDQEEHASGHATAGPRRRHRKGDTVAMAAVLADGGTQEQAAKAGGISVREVRRRQHEPGVRAQVREIHRERRRRAVASIADGFLTAIETMGDLQSPELAPEMRWKAAKEMLNAGFKNLDIVEDDQRFEDLEATVRDKLDPKSHSESDS
jgi:hypothetical protein